jgi:mRNA-degrading endonuclease RelE of RelBE toxin-antitoxin system
MSYNVIAVPKFKQEFKRLAKKYPTFKDDFLTLIESLENKPNQGTPLGKNCYKIRFVIKSKGKGKSGGARLITHIVVSDTIVYLLSIYDKADKVSLSDKEISALLEMIK